MSDKQGFVQKIETMDVAPRLFALCGNPTAGKSEVARILFKKWGYEEVDTGLSLRRICIDHLGLSEDDVFTQEGKLRESVILGKTWQHRKLLGDLGKALEGLLGDDITCYMAMKQLDPEKRYAFSGVRMNQGLFYKEHGAIVVGVRRPGALPSLYAFDRFNKSAVDYWIDNDGSLDDLEAKVEAMLCQIVQGKLSDAVASRE